MAIFVWKRSRQVFTAGRAIVLACALLYVVLLTSGVSAQPFSEGKKHVLVTIDGVQLEIESALLTTSTFEQSLPTVASATSYTPHRSLIVTAIPFGSQSDLLPIARQGSAQEFPLERARLLSQQTQTPQDGPSLQAFGQAVKGHVYHLLKALDTLEEKPALFLEWVVEADRRVWLIQLFWEIQDDEAELLTQIQIASQTTLIQSKPAPEASATDGSFAQQAKTGKAYGTENPLPPAPWWKGELCDRSFYQKQSGIITSSLGASYRGVEACKPRPWFKYKEGPDVLRTYGGVTPQGNSATFSAFEWECVEYSMRFLWLAYGTTTYYLPKMAQDIVRMYNHTGAIQLTQESNGKSRSLSPGDVLAFSLPAGYGHTAVVADVQLDKNGNGQIVIVEQNADTGSRTLKVRGWRIEGSVTGWLHNPNGDKTPSVSLQYTNGQGSTQLQATYLPTGSKQNDIFALSTNSGNNVLDRFKLRDADSRWQGWEYTQPDNDLHLTHLTVSAFADSRTVIFGRDSTGKLWYRYKTQVISNAFWSKWIFLGDGFSGQVEVSYLADGRLNVFAISEAGMLWEAQQRGESELSPWEPIELLKEPGLKATHIAASAYQDEQKRTVLFVRTNTGVLLETARTSAANARWSDWKVHTLDDTTFAGPLRITLLSDGRLQLFATSNDGQLWQTWQEKDRSSAFRTWEHVALPTGQSVYMMSALSLADGKTLVVLHASNGSIFVKRSTIGSEAKGTDWQEIALPEATVVGRQLQVSRLADGRAYIFVVNTRGEVMGAYEDEKQRILSWEVFPNLKDVSFIS